jgi:hypothetical protein
MSLPDSIEFQANVKDRIVISLSSLGAITSIDLTGIQNIYTATYQDLLDPITLLPITLPMALTQSPANVLVWFTPEFILTNNGDYVAEFLTDGSPPDFNYSVEVVSGSVPVPTPVGQLCSIRGNVVDGQKHGIENVSVSARMLAPPTLLGTAGVSTDPTVVVTDVNGYFEFEFLRLATIDVIIPEISYRRTLVVPDADTADLFTIP